MQRATILASETPDQRKARQFADLRTLAHLAMDLAQDAHALAKRQLAPRAPNPPGAPANIGADYARIFAVLSRAVRQAIAQEMRLEAGPRTRPICPASRRSTGRRARLPLIGGSLSPRIH